MDNVPSTMIRFERREARSHKSRDKTFPREFQSTHHLSNFSSFITFPSSLKKSSPFRQNQHPRPDDQSDGGHPSPNTSSSFFFFFFFLLLSFFSLPHPIAHKRSHTDQGISNRQHQVKDEHFKTSQINSQTHHTNKYHSQ